MKHEYESAWWRASVPEDWVASEDDACVTFSSREFPGALQVSAAIKATAPVNNADLNEFADQRIANQHVKHVKTPHFSGIHVEYVAADKFWREWWLRSGNLMLYVTYNIQKDLKDIERAAIDEFISGLRPFIKRSRRA